MKRVALLSLILVAGCGGGGGGGERVTPGPDTMSYPGLYDAVTRRGSGESIGTTFARISDLRDVEIQIGSSDASVPDKITGSIDSEGVFLGEATMPSGLERPMTGEIVTTANNKARLTVDFNDGTGNYRIDVTKRSWQQYNYVIVDWDGGGFSSAATVGPSGALFSEIGGGVLSGTFSAGGDFNGKFVRDGNETRIQAPFSRLVGRRFQVASTGWPDDPEKPYVIEMVIQ